MTSFLPVAESVLVAGQEYDNLYQSASNTMKSASRVVAAQTYRIDMPNKNMGATSVIDLPQGQLLSTTMLALKLDGAAGNWAAGVNVRESWGFDAIDYIEYAFAGSEKLVLSGQHMLQKHMADCESSGKRTAISDLSGAKIKGAGAVVEPDPTAYVCLYLPFSNVNSSRVIPFDSSLLSRPVRITIRLAQREAFYAPAVPGDPVPAAAQSTFSDAYIMVKTGTLKDDGDSIRDMVGVMGSSQYTYGYMYPLQYTSSDEFGGKTARTDKQSVRITGFQNGSVGSMDIWLELVEYNDALLGAGTVRRCVNSLQNRQLMLKLRNLEVLYAGQQIWTSPDDTDLLMSLAEYPVNNAFGASSACNVVAGAGVDDGLALTSYWYHVQLSQFNETFFSNLVQSGVNFTNNTVEIRFNTPFDSELQKVVPYLLTGTRAGAATISNPKYRLHANINYQAGILVAKGAAQTTFVPPVPVLSSTLSF